MFLTHFAVLFINLIRLTNPMFNATGTMHSVYLKNTLMHLVCTIVIQLTTFTVFGLTKPEDFYPDTFQNRVYDRAIRTVLLRNASWELSVPVIEKGSAERLELHFDDLGMQPRRLGYTLVHCDVAWRNSGLATQEYLDGFGSGMVRESAASFNTTCDYRHYQLLFPEEECRPLISGNYALVVYEEDDPSRIILTRRFFITEQAVQLSGRVKQPSPGEFMDTGQQLEFTVDYNTSLVSDPFRELTVVIRQNDHTEQILRHDNTVLSSTGKLVYQDHPGTLFMGGNEYRTVDFKSLKYLAENISSIDFRHPWYHVYLKTDEVRAHKPYFYKADFNGGFFIAREKADDKHVEGDYAYVHFSCAAPASYAGENLWITGGFCNWELEEGNRMVFNPQRNCFEVSLLLKQGFYDYCYVMTDPLTGKPDAAILEGSYYETRNAYAIRVYYHDRRNRYDRLVGYLNLP